MKRDESRIDHTKLGYNILEGVRDRVAEAKNHGRDDCSIAMAIATTGPQPKPIAKGYKYK